jgi:hypothetical protein
MDKNKREKCVFSSDEIWYILSKKFLFNVLKVGV